MDSEDEAVDCFTPKAVHCEREGMGGGVEGQVACGVRRLEELPEEMLTCIVHNYIEKREVKDEDGEMLCYYKMRYALHLAAVNKVFHRIICDLPMIRYHVKDKLSSASPPNEDLKIFAQTSSLDEDGDYQEKACGLVWADIHVEQTERWSIPAITLTLSSFVDHRLDECLEDECLIQTDYRFALPFDVFNVPAENCYVVSKPTIQYKGWKSRIYKALQDIQVDEDGDVDIDSNQPRKLLLSKGQAVHKTFKIKMYCGPDEIDLKMNKKIVNMLEDIGIVTHDKCHFVFDTSILKDIMEYPLSKREQMTDRTVERAARKQAMDSIKRVRSIEDEESILRLMQENDAESYERDKKRLCPSSVSSSGSSSGSSSSSSSSSSALEILLDRRHRLRKIMDEGTECDASLTGRLMELDSIIDILTTYS